MTVVASKARTCVWVFLACVLTLSTCIVATGVPKRGG